MYFPCLSGSRPSRHNYILKNRRGLRFRNASFPQLFLYIPSSAKPPTSLTLPLLLLLLLSHNFFLLLLSLLFPLLLFTPLHLHLLPPFPLTIPLPPPFPFPFPFPLPPPLPLPPPPINPGLHRLLRIILNDDCLGLLFDRGSGGSGDRWGMGGLGGEW